jgi:lysyl endopeptidase
MRVLVAVLGLLLAGPGFARMYEEPKSFSLPDNSLDRVDRKTLAGIEPERLLAEDREQGKNLRRPGPLRFAVPEQVAFDLKNSGTWQKVPDGSLWRLRIHSPRAVSHNLGITRFNLPEGAKLWIYEPALKQVEGPYTARHRSRQGRLWTPLIAGDEIVVEVFVPGEAPEADVGIGTVNKGYRDFASKGGDKNHGACNNDVICPEGDPWRNQIRSVARYSIDGVSLCTGQLVNNTALNFIPYFLSANHCNVTTANEDTLVFFWNFEASVCGNQNGGSLADTQTGAFFLASSAPSDFLLVRLAQDPDPAFNVFFSGWDVSGAAVASTVGIHHPSGDVKSISFNTNAVTSTAYLSGTASAAENHWRVDAWEDGTTEPGSSGSCLWDAATGRCVGQLHGGFAFCNAPTQPDWYGKLSVSWTGGGTNDTRLRNWLDPGNTGVVGLDGDTHVTTVDGVHYDFQAAGEFVSVRRGDSMEIQTRMEPIATTFNPGPDPYDGLATCVSLNTAVAARVGRHRVTYQPNSSGVPDPSGLQLRVDGVLTTLGAAGQELGDGSRLSPTAAPGGLEIGFPDRSALFVTPGWWADQGKWYLNVDLLGPPSVDRMNGAAPGGTSSSGTSGIAGTLAPESWLPPLPDGTSMGPMPGPLHDLYQKFGDAWRVTRQNSLFDYAPGTTTDTFTMRDWPLENLPCVLPEARSARPESRSVAQRVCRGVTGKNVNQHCVFDVMVTGHPGFAETYRLTQPLLAGATAITVTDERNPTRVEEPVRFTATVVRRTMAGKGRLAGAVQFMIDGERAGPPVQLEPEGQATWTERLRPGKHKVTASYMPSEGSVFLPSSSPEMVHIVGVD